MLLLLFVGLSLLRLAAQQFLGVLFQDVAVTDTLGNLVGGISPVLGIQQNLQARFSECFHFSQQVLEGLFAKQMAEYCHLIKNQTIFSGHKATIVEVSLYYGNKN